MERKQVNDELHLDLYDFDGRSWESCREALLERIDSLPEEHRSGAIFVYEPGGGPYDDPTRACFIFKRDETDEEVAKRLERKEYYAQLTEAKDREEYERLKAKFEG